MINPLCVEAINFAPSHVIKRQIPLILIVDKYVLIDPRLELIPLPRILTYSIYGVHSTFFSHKLPYNF